MPSAAASVPAPEALLCEQCGYVLTGLPADGHCPECGRPIADSDPAHRHPPAWETAIHARFSAFLHTTVVVLFQPSRFYRTFATRSASLRAAHRFALWHWLIVSILLALAAVVHLNVFVTGGVLPFRAPWGFISLRDGLHGPIPLLGFLLLVVVVLFCLEALSRLAAKLTTWEATYRGLRLPYASVLRALYYHAAHYLPVALVAAATVLGYQILLARDPAYIDSATTYLYVLCGEVIAGAVYLFKTYWIAMRRTMYANA